MITSKIINRRKDPNKSHFSAILIIRLDEIGDVATSLHVFELLKRSHPDSKITLWCKPFIRRLLVNDPHIDRIIHTKEELNGPYDLHVDLRGNWHSIFYSFIHPPKFRLDRASIRLRNKYAGGQKHEVFTNLDIIAPVLNSVPANPELKIYLGKPEQGKAEAFLLEKNISAFAIFHCGARRALRKWNHQGFAEIARYLKSEKNLDIVFAGDRTDKEDIEKIQQMIPFKTFSIAEDFNLIEFAALCSKSSLFIGNESGPMHIAAATGIPVIGLFGPGVPVTFYPYGEKCSYVHHVLPCNPCDQIHCVQPDHPCINMITVQEVIEKIEKALLVYKHT